MAAAPVAPPPVSADDELVYESLPCIRVYKNRVERYFGSEFVPASTDAATATTGVASRDVVISATVSARLYLPPRLGDDAGDAKLPVLVYYHGGGFCIGSAFNPIFHAYFTALAGLAGFLVVSVEYRLAPEHPVPAAYADSWDALAWVVSHSAPAAGGGGNSDRDPWIAGHADFSRLYLGGESAGANIAHHMAMRAATAAEGLAHGARIRGLVLVHPYFLGTDWVASDELDPATRESLGALWRVVRRGRRRPAHQPPRGRRPGAGVPAVRPRARVRRRGRRAPRPRPRVLRPAQGQRVARRGRVLAGAEQGTHVPFHGSVL